MEVWEEAQTTYSNFLGATLFQNIQTYCIIEWLSTHVPQNQCVVNAA